MREIPPLDVLGSDVAWANQTYLHPLGLCVLICLGIALLLLPRRLAIWPFIIMACFVPSGQRLVVAELDFSLLRILTLVGWLRIVCRGETRGLALHPLDWTMAAWSISGIVIYTLQFATVSALVFRLGGAFDAIGLYFLFRCLIRGWEDVDQTVVGFAVVSIPVALAFFAEHKTGRNLFAFLGGVPEITLVRDGRMRCQGAFSHPILAGCFWASLMPLIAACWWRGGRARLLTAASLLACGLIVVFCASSTPLMAIVLGMFGGAMFAARRLMRAVCWGTVAMLAGLHMVMQAPVWHLIARLDLTGSSTGWHRYFLIDAAIAHLGEWWLLGTRTTGHWHPLLRDVTNHYILEGVRGGLLTMLLFILGIALAFRGVGRLWRSAPARPQTIMAWALGVTLFLHCANYIAVAYFGQIEMLWYLHMAMIGSLSAWTARRAQPARPREPLRRRPPQPRTIPLPMANASSWHGHLARGLHGQDGHATITCDGPAPPADRRFLAWSPA